MPDDGGGGYQAQREGVFLLVMCPVVLITGIRSFTGAYLTEEFRQAGYRVVGLVQGESAGADEYACDLLERDRLFKIIAEVKPDFVVHLAAISFVAHGDVGEIYRSNLLGTLNLLEGLAVEGVQPRKVLLASSANVYGNTEAVVLDESLCPAPENHYAVSKLAMENAARLWFDRLPIIITRPFNYSGVGQAEHFLLPKIVSHFRRGAHQIELGNIDVARDFSDVRVVVAIYRRLLESGAVGQIFNVCSGVAHTLAGVLDTMAGIAGYAIQVRVNPAFVRANEVKRLVGSDAKLRLVIEMPDAISLEETLRWMYAQPGALSPAQRAMPPGVAD